MRFVGVNYSEDFFEFETHSYINWMKFSPRSSSFTSLAARSPSARRSRSIFLERSLASLSPAVLTAQPIFASSSHTWIHHNARSESPHKCSLRQHKVTHTRSLCKYFRFRFQTEPNFSATDAREHLLLVADSRLFAPSVTGDSRMPAPPERLQRLYVSNKQVPNIFGFSCDIFL